MELSAKIKAKRESLGLTIKEMSDALGFGKDGDRLSGSGKKAKSAPQTNSTGSLRLLRLQPHSRRRKVIPDLNL